MSVPNLCCGARKRTAAFIAAGAALAISFGLILLVAILLITSYRETTSIESRRALGNLYAASLVIFGCWSLLTFVLLGGIRVENKRALLVWGAFSLLVPLVLVVDVVYLVTTGHTGSPEISYLVALGIAVLFIVYISVAIYSYYVEVKLRDKNPDLRAADYVMNKPTLPYELSMTAMTANMAASESSVFRSQRQPAFDGASNDQWRGGSEGRQQRTLDVDSKKGSRSASRAGSRDSLAERDGGTYYHHQYAAERPSDRHRSGSQGSLSIASSRQGLDRPMRETGAAAGDAGVDSTV